MKVNEIFYSIQGEGIYTGVPTVFVRLQGCNLLPHCSYCDTTYAQDSNKGDEKSIEEIVKRVTELSPYYKSWVCITGGEPLWQKDELEELVKELKKNGYQLTIETNGSFKVPSWYTLVDSWNADIKCPSSGICGVSNEVWMRTRICDQVKFVVGTREDLGFAREMIQKHIADNPIVLVSPVLPRNYNEGGDGICMEWEWLQEVVELCKEMRVRFSLQVHKVVFGNRRGV